MLNSSATRAYFEELSRTIPLLPLNDADRLVRLLLAAHDTGHAVFLFGNGGSAALASHMACDLGKGASNGSGKRLRVLALTDNVPLITAWANDASYKDVFAQQLQTFVRPGDVVCAISASGDSPNVLAALRLARKSRAITAGIAGCQGGKMKQLCDVCVVVPSSNMQIIEDLHLSIAHAIFTAVRREIHGAAGKGRVAQPIHLSSPEVLQSAHRSQSGTD
jgi:D-sedoheptulose 7-phosphate isomerase